MELCSRRSEPSDARLSPITIHRSPTRGRRAGLIDSGARAPDVACALPVSSTPHDPAHSELMMIIIIHLYFEMP